MEKRLVIQLVEKLSKKYTVSAILKVLKIPCSTYYRWKKGLKEYKNKYEDLIVEICKSTKYHNGHRKIKASLKTKEFQYYKFNSITNLKVVSKFNDYMYHYIENRVQEKLG